MREIATVPFLNDLNGNQGMSLLGPNLKGMGCISTGVCSHLYGYSCWFNIFVPLILMVTESFLLPWS